MKTKVIISLVFCVLFALSLAPNTSTDKALGADGTAGDLECGTTTYVIGQPMVFYLSGLTVNADFNLGFTAGVATNITWTQGVVQSKMSFTVKLAAPTTGDVANVWLTKQSADSVVIDSVMLSATDYTDIIPEELIIGLAITILVISILVGIAVTMRIRKK